MAWTSTGTGEILVSKDVSKFCLAQRRVDYDNGEDAAIRYRVHGDVWFFATTTRTVKVVRGLTRAAAEGMTTAAGANASTWNYYIEFLLRVSVNSSYSSAMNYAAVTKNRMLTNSIRT